MTGHALLTGASGFIAKHVAIPLLGSGWRVRATVRSQRRRDEVRAALAPHVAQGDLDTRLSFVDLDPTSDIGWAVAAQGVDAVVHTASPFPLLGRRKRTR